MKLWQRLSGTMAAILLSGCVIQGNPIIEGEGILNAANSNVVTTTVVSGSISYKERVTLPENAMVTITLADAARMDVPVKILSQVSFPVANKSSPFHFSLPYSQAQVLPASRVIVSARIEYEGKLLFITNGIYEVVTNSRHTADVELISVMKK